MKILAIGCSFTYGMELPDCPPSTFYVGKDASKLAYPALLANKLNAELTNLSLPGGSNSRTFRVAMDESTKKQYDLVICQWTDISRLDIRYNQNDFPVTANSRWLDRDFPWIKEYFKNHYDDSHSYQTWITQVIALQNYFKSTDQRYLFANMVPMRNTVDKEFQHLIKQIDTDYYIGWPHYAMVDWMGNCPKGPGGHPLELGHKRIADKIYEHIRTLGWLP
jgi:hypothetical protein